MRVTLHLLSALVVLEIAAALAIWVHLWRICRRPGVAGYRYWDRDAYAARDELFHPAAMPILRRYARLGWALAATLTATILVYLAGHRAGAGP